jgi:cytochrome c-type biogenesis protein CcmH/NrfG
MDVKALWLKLRRRWAYGDLESQLEKHAETMKAYESNHLPAGDEAYKKLLAAVQTDLVAFSQLWNTPVEELESHALFLRRLKQKTEPEAEDSAKKFFLVLGVLLLIMIPVVLAAASAIYHHVLGWLI